MEPKRVLQSYIVQEDSRPMARPLRLALSRAVYYVTSRGNARQDIAAEDHDRSQFLFLLAHVVDPDFFGREGRSWIND